MKRIWSSETISMAKKEELLADLKKQVGEGEWLDNTIRYCEAAAIENKQKVWDIMTAIDKNETEKWGLTEWKYAFAGFNQVQ